MNKKLTLITGANRGMGFELAKELGLKGQHVLVGSRRFDDGAQAVASLEKLGITAEVLVIDVANSESIKQAAASVASQHGYLDILINNAGIALDNYEKPSMLAVETIRKDFDVNFFGLIEVTQAMLPLLKKSNAAKILNISSAVGSLTKASDPTTSIYQHSAVGYQASKTAVNMFTVDLANELSGSSVTVNAVNPGWVATTFAGGGGDKSAAEGVARTVELATSADNTINGTFSDMDGIVPW